MTPQHKIDYQIVDAQGRVVRNATSSQKYIHYKQGKSFQMDYTG